MRNRKDRHYSKRQLERSIRKMGEVIMIGAIAAIEEKFGDLWGEDSEREDFTPEEEAMYAKWEELRDEILDHGNKNIDYMVNMLASFKVQMSKTNTTFNVKKGTIHVRGTR